MEIYLNQTQNKEIKQWIKSNLVNYLKTTEANQGEIEHIIDYFHARKEAYENKGKSFNLKKMSYKQAKDLAEKWIKTLKKKGRDIVETEVDTETVLDFKNGIRLVRLVGASAFKREGHLMSHCVASYYGKNDIEVYSLRDAKNNPHCTIEIVKNKDSINQIKGKGNGSIHPKYIKYVIKILKYFNKDVRKSELTHLGYDEINDNLFGFLLHKFPRIKYITYQNSNFIYRYQKVTQ